MACKKSCVPDEGEMTICIIILMYRERLLVGGCGWLSLAHDGVWMKWLDHLIHR